jgi:cystathionine beta-lyase
MQINCSFGGYEMQYDFDSWVPRIGTQSSKWQHLISDDPLAPENMINLGIAEMDLVCSEGIIKAIQNRAQKGILGYTSSRDPEYLESICSWQERRFKLKVHPDQIIYCRGANLALDLVVRAFSSPGQGVIIQPPVFQNFAGVIQRNGRVIVENNLLKDKNGNWSMNLAELEEMASHPNNVLLLLCSPNNPTGNLWSEEDLRRLGEICLQNGVKIVSDDVHQEIIREGSVFVSLAALFPESEDIITLTSLSKGFNLAGLQVCHMIIPLAEDREAIQGILGRHGPDPLDIAATIGAYVDSDDWLEQVNRYIDGNVRFLDNYMAKELPHVAYASPQATYLPWIDLGWLGWEQDQLMTFLREKAKVQLNSGASYGSSGKGFVRLNVATPRSVLEEALNRVKTAVSS